MPLQPVPLAGLPLRPAVGKVTQRKGNGEQSPKRNPPLAKSVAGQVSAGSQQVNACGSAGAPAYVDCLQGHLVL